MGCKQNVCSRQGFIETDKMLLEGIDLTGKVNLGMPIRTQIDPVKGALSQLGSSCQMQVLTRRHIIRTFHLSTWHSEMSNDDSTPFQVGKKMVVEERWHNFFSDLSQWWDHRVGKTSVRYPDFKHKTTRVGLWVHDKSNPDWVKAKLAALTPGAVDLPNVFWNKKLARYTRDGQHLNTLDLYHEMQQVGRSLDTFTFVPVLKACGSLQALDEGREIHAQIIQSGCELDIFVGTGLIDMYVKFRNTEEARRIFNKMCLRDVVTWTAMIVGYVKCGQSQKALDLYELMEMDGVKPVAATFTAVLNACASVLALERGKKIHEEVIKSCCQSDPFVSASLVDMYAKCGSIDLAQRVFNSISNRTVISWTALIMGYVRCGQGWKALEQYELMQMDQVDPVPLTFVGVLNACANVRALEEGRSVHQQIVQSGCNSDVFVSTSLVDMYVKCGSIEEARLVFNEMVGRTVVSWNAMLTGYLKCGQSRQALDLYQQMRLAGVKPVPVTFVGVLNACASLQLLDQGRQFHAQIIDYQCESNVFVATSLVDMYVKCGCIEDAWRVFNNIEGKDSAAWTAIIAGYVKFGQGQKALALYQQMQLEGLEPAPETAIMVLKACASEVPLEEDTEVVL